MVRTVTVAQPGGPEVLRQAEAAAAPLAPGEVRVDVRFAGVNFWDVMQRRGVVPLGAGDVPGVEGAGSIVETGEGADASRLGERVVWSRVSGSYADQLTGPADSFVPVPGGLSDDDAARVLMQGITAQYLAEETWPLGPGEHAVVHAAAGGVGTLLTQFLVAREVRVIGMVSRPEKRQASLDAGAAEVVVGGDGYVDGIRAIAPAGVGAVFDANGGEDALRGLDVLRTRGALVMYGTAGGSIPQLDLARLGNGSLYVTRASGRDYSRTPQEWRTRADDVLARAAAGTLRATAGGVWPLGEAAEAHRHLESRTSTGKLLLATG